MAEQNCTLFLQQTEDFPVNSSAQWYQREAVDYCTRLLLLVIRQKPFFDQAKPNIQDDTSAVRKLPLQLTINHQPISINISKTLTGEKYSTVYRPSWI